MEQYWSRIAPHLRNHMLVYVVAAVLLVAVPLTVYMSQSEQDIRQEAAGKKNDNKNQNGDKNKNDKKNNKNDKGDNKNQNNKKNKNKKRCSKKERAQGTCKKDPKPKSKKGAVDRTLDLTLLLDGIGSAGDQSNPDGQGTEDPIRPDRDVFVEIYDSNNVLAAEAEGTVSYDPSDGAFKGSVVAPLPPGAYTAIVDMDYYPAVAIPGIINVEAKGKLDKKKKQSQKQNNNNKKNNKN